MTMRTCLGVLRRCDGETREFWKEMVRPAGFEPATLGLEGRPWAEAWKLGLNG